MGKDYKKELSNLDSVYQNAYVSNVQLISGFLHKYSNSIFWGVGSGGSYSVARIFEFLCAKAGWIAKSITPLELYLYDAQLRDSAAILFTASGRNADSINAYRFLGEIETEGLLTCCMRVEAPLKKLQKDNLHSFYFEHKMPVMKDGYLAVESLVASSTLLCKAFETATNNPFFKLPKQFDWHTKIIDSSLLRFILSRETIIVLHGGITTPSAIDLESKFSETALGNIQLVDFRNFAHGRHYWLSNRKESTGIVAIVGTHEQELATKTLELLPNGIPILRYDVNDNSIVGLLDSLDFVFELVLQSGIIRGINPGKPKVDDFGKKLYHLRNNICENDQFNQREKHIEQMAIYRKCNVQYKLHERTYLCAASEYLKSLRAKCFYGIVFDYDGTLHNKERKSITEQRIFEKINSFLANKVKIGIATGRGKSVRKELQQVISADYWKDVVIAYYNGGCLGTLDDELCPNKSGKRVSQEFLQLSDYLRSINLPTSIKVDGLDDNNPFQITVLGTDKHIKSYIEMIKCFCAEAKRLKLIESSHSIDIIPASSSKNNIFDFWAQQNLSKNDFLSIGDSGQLGGNDYELLSGKCGLSVDRVSDSYYSCWNYAKPGFRNLEATLFYLEKIDVLNDGRFTIRRLK